MINETDKLPTPEEAAAIKEQHPNNFQLSIEIAELQKRSIFLATPMYGGQCAGMYTRSIVALSEVCARYGIKLQMYFMFNESLITRARNYCVDEFMRSGCTHLLFIDSDIGFDPQDVLTLLSLQDDKSPYDVIGGPYPKKSLLGNTLVVTENGTKSLKSIVESGYKGKVQTISEKTGDLSWQNILTYTKYPRLNKNLVTIKTSRGKSKTQLVSTEDHEFLVVDDPLNTGMYYMRADSIEGKYAVKSISKKSHENTAYNKEQIQVLLGTALGDGHINKAGVFSVGHSDKQLDYVNLKRDILGGTVKRYESKGYSKTGFSNLLNSRVNTQTKFLRELLYPENIKTVKNVLPYLDERSLAFWYMDDGSLKHGNRQGRPWLVLHTEGFSDEDQVLIKNWLFEKYGIESVIDTRNDHENKSFKNIRLNCDNSEKFWRLISKYVPASMQYKLPEKFVSETEYNFNNTRLEFTMEKIVEVSMTIENNKTDFSMLYDIGVENNHNFIANRYHVSNCISWEKIYTAVNKGVADENPNVLENFVGDYVFNPKMKPGVTSIPINAPVEVGELGTGFMMIRRKTFEDYQKAYPELMYRPDHVRTDHFDGTREIMAFFDTIIDPVTKRYLSEDYMYCVPSSAKVETEDGPKSIKWITDNKYTGKVKSVTETGMVTWNNVSDWSVRMNKDKSKKWVKLNTTADNNTKSKLIITDDHKIAVIDDIFSPTIRYIPAKDTTDKYVARDVQRTENALYNKEQLSSIYGSLMGDMSISKNGQLTGIHCLNQKEYIELKARLWDGKIFDTINSGFGLNKPAINIFCGVNAQTKLLREKIYGSGKKTVDFLLPLLDEISLAFWYMDDGSYSKSATSLSTESFTYEEHIKIKEMFKDKFNIDVIITKKSVKYKGEIRNYFYTRLLIEEANKLFEIIAKYFPESMEYKLPIHFRASIKHEFDTKKLDIAASKIKEVQYLPNYYSKLYDISVENYHNFLANGTFVHNCYNVQKMGGSVWLCPWMQLQHVGSYVFGGSLSALASIGASPTADPTEMEKIRKSKKK